MNYNEEIFNELKKRSDGIDQKNLTTFGENNKIERSNLPCGSLVQNAVKMRQELTDSFFGVEELGRIYEKTPVSDYFSLSSHADSDFGVVRHLKIRKKLRKSNYFIEKKKFR